ncbi:MAG: hypothetical protein L0229_06975 [Blastocatellia bacterium]|nr:hypothetical protein [Blastocatellia bacterium]
MSESRTKSDGLGRSRRRFAKSLAVMAATPILSHAAEARAHESSSLDRAASQTQAPQKYPPAVEAMGEAVRYRYGKYLDESQLDEVKRRIDRNLRFADMLKQVELKNGDEPAFIFSADLPSTK